MSADILQQMAARVLAALAGLRVGRAAAGVFEAAQAGAPASNVETNSAPGAVARPVR
jgi:hypothetical protein